jgi:hypothetical protein
MTSDLDVERILVHCSCGAAIAMCGKKETCSDCGETIEIVRCVPTPHGPKYKLRISKHRWKTEPLLWPPGLPPAATTHQTWHHHEPADFNKRCLRLGLLILLAPLYLPLVFALLIHEAETVKQDQSNARIIELAQPPTDCGFFSGCHYERREIHGNDKRGPYIVVTWERVND